MARQAKHKEGPGAALPGGALATLPSAFDPQRAEPSGSESSRSGVGADEIDHLVADADGNIVAALVRAGNVTRRPLNFDLIRGVGGSRANL